MFLMPFGILLSLKAFMPIDILLANEDFKTKKIIDTDHFLNYDEDDCEDAIYIDITGLVVIEAENLVIDQTNWNIKIDFNGYTGTGYLSWDGNNNFNSPGNGLISTRIKINTPGTYRFR